MVLDAIGVVVAGVGWLLDFLIAMAQGWLYLLSPSFRAHKRREWARDRDSSALIDVIAGVTGVVLSTGLAVAAWIAWRG